MPKKLLSTHLACGASVPAECIAGSIILVLGCEVEQTTAVKTSFQFMPGSVAYGPPGGIDDICLCAAVNSQT